MSTPQHMFYGEIKKITTELSPKVICQISMWKFYHNIQRGQESCKQKEHVILTYGIAFNKQIQQKTDDMFLFFVH